MKIILEMPDEHFEYLLYTLDVARREISLNNRFKGHVRQIHLDRLNKLISELEIHLPENKRNPLPYDLSTFDKTMVDSWRMDGYSDKEIAGFLEAL